VAKYDLESFCDQLQSSLISKINSKISVINTEKNVGKSVGDAGYLALDSIPAGAIIFNSLDDNAANFKDFIFYFIDGIVGENAGPVIAQKTTVEIAVFLLDRQDLMMQKRTLRMMRALFETACDLWSTIGLGYDKPEITVLTPVDLQLNNSSYYHKIVAVRIEFSIAN
jgi:hypothetical protein